MTPITYRIPITAYVINNEEAPERNALQTLEGIRKHLYLAANIAYQHYYQLLAKEDPVQKNLFEKYNKFRKADEEAWKKYRSFLMANGGKLSKSEAIVYLQLHKGISRQEAMKIVNSFQY